MLPWVMLACGFGYLPFASFFKTFHGLIAVEEVSYDSQEHPNPLTKVVVLRI